MVKFITPAVFRKIVHRRHASEKKVLAARIQHTEAMADWKNAYFRQFYYAAETDPALKLIHVRQKRAQKKHLKAMQKAAADLTKKLKAHRSLVEKLKKDYRFHPDDKNTYDFTDCLPPFGAAQKRRLMNTWREKAKNSLQVEVCDTEKALLKLCPG